MQARTDTDDEIPVGWREAAEEVRAHLVALRGGAPFLSPADSLLLVQWFEAEVPVSDILRGLERAAEARKRRPSRIPLRLSHAKRHIGKPTRGVFHRDLPAVDPQEPLGCVVQALCGAPPGPALRALKGGLLAVRGREADGLFREASACVRRFFEARWVELGVPGQEGLREEAARALGDLLDLVDERTRGELVDEAARDRLREGYPALAAASLWEVVDAVERA